MKIEDMMMCCDIHPMEKTWKHFDNVYADFSANPRHIRPNLCFEGFTPYVQASTFPYCC